MAKPIAGIEKLQPRIVAGCVLLSGTCPEVPPQFLSSACKTFVSCTSDRDSCSSPVLALYAEWGQDSVCRVGSRFGHFRPRGCIGGLRLGIKFSVFRRVHCGVWGHSAPKSEHLDTNIRQRQVWEDGPGRGRACAHIIGSRSTWHQMC